MAILAVLPLLLKVVEAAKAAIPAGSAAYDQFNELGNKMKVFVAEDREPTKEEFRELQEETDALTDRLEAANNRLQNGG